MDSMQYTIYHLTETSNWHFDIPEIYVIKLLSYLI